MRKERKKFENSWCLVRFKKLFGEDIYQEIEDKYGVVGKKVILKKDPEFGEGTIIGLWIPADKTRKNNLWYVDWKAGSNGIVELKDLEFI